MRSLSLLVLSLLSGCATPTPEDEEMKQEFARQLTPFLQQLPATWEAMQGKGVTTDTRLRLAFSYRMPSGPVARDLAGMLRREFGYETQVSELEGAGGWHIQGHTSETTLTVDILRQWLGYMVQRGVECGGRFEGWSIGETRSQGA